MRVAILAPASEEGMQRVSGFRSEFERRGGHITGTQWYYRKTTNFRKPLELLATADQRENTAELHGLEATPADSLADSLSEGSGNGVVYADTALVRMPINRLSALYVPVQGEEMALLAPQLAAMGFQGHLIGNSNCLDLVEQEANRRYVEGMVFPSNFPTPQGWDPDSDFAKIYQAKTGAPPNRWNVLGWDAFNFLSSALKDPDKLSSLKVMKRMQDVRRFQGIHLVLLFAEGDRENRSFHMLKFESGQLKAALSPQQVADSYQP